MNKPWVAPVGLQTALIPEGSVALSDSMAGILALYSSGDATLILRPDRSTQN